MDRYIRRLPHIQPVGGTLFVTWTLAGVIPLCKRISGFSDQGVIFSRNDRELDKAKAGPRWLMLAEVADVVRDVMFFGQDRGDYDLGAWVIMPNHVHMVVRPFRPLWAVMREIKTYSARMANRILDREGQAFWQREYYDRVIRDCCEEARVTRYIELNPVRAGLCERAEEFVHGSAHELSVHRPEAGATRVSAPE